jgi:hypothetical protein
VTRGRLLLVALAIAVANAVLPLIGQDFVVPANIIAPMLVCIVSGWLMMFQVGGVSASRSWRDWIFFGPLAPNPDEWVKPLPPSKVSQVFVLSAGAALGGVVGIMFLAAGGQS